MIAVVSPAKTLDFETQPCTELFTEPSFLKDSSELVKRLRKLSEDRLGELMGISPKLAGLNYARFQEWTTPFNTQNARPALLAFKGDVYAGLQAQTFSDDQFLYAQDHLRILSGLYGLLRPLDLIQPYRLEMGTSLDTIRGKNLYEFWGDRITEVLSKDLQADDSGILINLASNEYFNAIQPARLDTRIVTPVFKDEKNGNFKIISFFAKKARGLMSRYIIETQPKTPEDLRYFDSEGYAYNAKESSEDMIVFSRPESAR